MVNTNMVRRIDAVRSSPEKAGSYIVFSDEQSFQVEESIDLIMRRLAAMGEKNG